MVQVDCMTIATVLAGSTVLLLVKSMTKFSVKQNRNQTLEFLSIKLLVFVLSVEVYCILLFNLTLTPIRMK